MTSTTFKFVALSVRSPKNKFVALDDHGALLSMMAEEEHGTRGSRELGRGLTDIHSLVYGTLIPIIMVYVGGGSPGASC